MMRTLSHVQGKGCLAHNNRCFKPKNVDSTRTPDNVIYIQQDIAEAYRNLFTNAVELYNARQKRNDRKIMNGYFEHVFNHAPCGKVIESPNGQKSFYEDVVQIGTKDDTGVSSPDAATAKHCLDEYMQGFTTRNPNFYVFNAVMHVDEATPHLHIDYIPIGHYTRGVPVQNGLAQALREMGYGGGKDAINRWRISERAVLGDICRAHGFEIAEENPGRGYSFTVEEYKKHRDTIKDYERQEETLRDEIQPLLDAKAIAEPLAVKGFSLPGNKEIINAAEFDALDKQKKAYALQADEYRRSSEQFQSRTAELDEREKALQEREAKVCEAEARLDQKFQDAWEQENAADALKWRAQELYNTQVDLNKRYEKSEKDREYYTDRCFCIEREKKKLEEKLQTTEKRLDDLRTSKGNEIFKLNEQINALTSENAELREKKRDHDKELKEQAKAYDEKVKDLQLKYDAANGLLDAAYEVGNYIGKRCGVNFSDALDKRSDGYSMSYIFGSGRER